MTGEEEIDSLACELLGNQDVDDLIKDQIRSATSDHSWDEAVKWNRVKWRVRFLRRSLPALASRQGPLTAAP